jgi:hypothetical protein
VKSAYSNSSSIASCSELDSRSLRDDSRQKRSTVVAV